MTQEPIDRCYMGSETSCIKWRQAVTITSPVGMSLLSPNDGDRRGRKSGQVTEQEAGGWGGSRREEERENRELWVCKSEREIEQMTTSLLTV